MLALELTGNKSFFAWRQGLLDFAQVCSVACPKDVICAQLHALEQVLAYPVELCERAPRLVAAIRRCAEPFMRSSG